jgi:hypothetical protein
MAIEGSGKSGSRKLVYDSLEFCKPGRVPRQLWLLPWANIHYAGELAEIQKEYPDDIVHCPCFYDEPLQDEGDCWAKGLYVDEFGCEFENKQDGIIGEAKKALISDWSASDKIRIPRERLSTDKEKANEFCRGSDKFVLSRCIARPFERLQFIRTTEMLYMDLAVRDDGLLDFLKKLHGFYIDEINMWADTDVDAVMIMDDWGSQNSLLISPDMWREIFKPLYREYAEAAHSKGKKIFMHSDGYIIDIIEDLIEVGIDALNSQVFCMGVEDLGERFSGRMTFWGEIDRQQLLPNGSEYDISAAVQKIYENLYSDGGVIAQMEFGPGAKPGNVKAALAKWNEISSKQW